MILAASVISCEVNPSEYAYKDDSFSRVESASANCRNYPVITNLPPGLHSSDYIHCNGTQLKLADSNLGSEQPFSSNSHYQWIQNAAQLLFIFPTRVSLTTITLHYYSDSSRGLPRLRFYAVLNLFDVWDALTTNTPRVDAASVPPGGKPVGHRSVSINVNFNTRKVLMYKFSSKFSFAVSEVEFFTCETTTTPTLTTIAFPSPGAQPDVDNQTAVTESLTTDKPTYFAATNSSSISMSTITSSVTDSTTSEPVLQSKRDIITIGVSIAMLLILSTTLVIIVVVLIWSYKRRFAKQMTNSPYSTLNRRTGQPQSVQQDSPELYDQIHLSPSTGQTEFFPESEIANINNPNLAPQNFYPTHSTAGNDIAEHSSTLNTANQATTSQLSSQKAHENTSELPTYAAVDKSKVKFKKQTKKEDPKHKSAEKVPSVSASARHEVPSASTQGKNGNTIKQEINSPHTIEELYTAIKKKPKDCEPKGKEETPPIPPHTVEELYTTVQNKPKSRFNADGNKDEAPPHRVEEMHTAGEKSSQVLTNMTEDLYTAVMKKPKDGSTDITEASPPIPPHTVEELYTAVMKMPKSSAEDEEKAPPIPPYTVEEN